MSVWSKVMTAFRGGINEAGEAIADSQALRILDQEIRDVDEELKASRESLAEIRAKQKVSEQKCTTLSHKITDFEEYAIQALEKDDEPLALDLAEKIAEFGKQHISEQNTFNDYSSNADKLRNTIKLADENIKQLKYQVETVRATADIQRAQENVAQRHHDSSSRLSTAMESLARIKEKQELNSAKLNAAQQIAEEHSPDSLNNRLEAAGIISDNLNSETILTQLKNKVTLRLTSDENSNQ